MSDFATRRTMMVDTQVRPSDVTKYPIIDAMLSVPRENFVPTGLRETAYMGENIDLDGGRVVLEPRTLAKMLDALDIGPDELVLDVACGYGYSSAVIARMAQAVVALEEDENMAREAQEALMDAGADNVVVHEGRLTEGAQEHGPYDVLVVQGAVAQLPDALISQLKDGGRAAALFMDGALGEVRVGYKMDGRITWRAAFNAGAPILPGFEKHHKFEL
ncbi:MAG: protein-L-isoaspartate O-methyltransferase [Paracoccaceae bacterium]